jgi:hypothetical protein
MNPSDLNDLHELVSNYNDLSQLAHDIGQLHDLNAPLAMRVAAEYAYICAAFYHPVAKSAPIDTEDGEHDYDVFIEAAEDALDTLLEEGARFYYPRALVLVGKRYLKEKRTKK